MHVVLNAIEEPLVHNIRLFVERLSIPLAEMLVGNLHLVTDTAQILSWVDVWNDTSVQHVLNILEEALMEHIVV